MYLVILILMHFLFKTKINKTAKKKKHTSNIRFSIFKFLIVLMLKKIFSVHLFEFKKFLCIFFSSFESNIESIFTF